jgi:hypothetical protein
MPQINILSVAPRVLKVGSEGLITIEPIHGVECYKIKIFDLQLIIDGTSYEVPNYQQGFERNDWSFTFFVPDSLLSLQGPTQLASVKFKAFANGQTLLTEGDYTITIHIEEQQPPFKVTSVDPTTLSINPDKPSRVVYIFIKGTGLKSVDESFYLVGPSKIDAFVNNDTDTLLTTYINSSDVKVFGQYHIILASSTGDTYLIPTTINIEEEATSPGIELLDITPDELSPGDNFVLQASKDTSQKDWEDIQIANITLATDDGESIPVEHAAFSATSATEASVNCTVSSSATVPATTSGTLSLSANFQGKPCSIKNSLEVKLKPHSESKTFTMTSCAPMRIKKEDIQNPNLKFSIMGTNLEQISEIKFGNSYLMNILSKTSTRLQSKLTTTSYNIPDGIYRFSVKYTNPQKGTEEEKIVQNIRITVYRE